MVRRGQHDSSSARSHLMSGVGRHKAPERTTASRAQRFLGRGTAIAVTLAASYGHRRPAMDLDDMNDVAAKRTAIRELLDTYHGAINFADWVALEGVFTEDAVWEALLPIDLRFEGRQAILEGLEQSVGRQELPVQSSSGILIDFSDDGSASVRSTLSEFGKEKGTGKGWRAIAVYFDRVVQRDGFWRFQRRTLQLRYQGDSPAPGQVVESGKQTDG